MSKTKFRLKAIALVTPLLYLGLLIADRQGVWSCWRGLDRVEAVAARFEQSYAPDASHPVSAGDPEWEPLISMIYQYSNANFPKDKQPQVVARSQATAAGQLRADDGTLIAEWTAPSTPIVLLYRKWPGQQIPRAS